MNVNLQFLEQTSDLYTYNSFDIFVTIHQSLAFPEADRVRLLRASKGGMVRFI